jgi:hypothetical protein
MAEEINLGAAYLSALQQGSSAKSAVGVAAATARETTASNVGATAATVNDVRQYQGTEKRRSTRYKCEGSVELAEDGCDARTSAKFTDVSLHGCYVEVQATYPVGTSLSIKMELNGVRLETKGVVRVNYPYLGMGIAFVDMTDENRERLKNLLCTVTYTRAIVGPGVTSVVPTCGVSERATTVTNPAAAIQALVEYFYTRQILCREDFTQIVAKSQGGDTKH